MAKKIVWRKKAGGRFREITEYLKREWSVKVAEEFVEIVLKKVELLKVFPGMGKSSAKKPGMKKLVLTKHNMLVYRIKEDKIILLNIYDTRWDSIKIEV